MSSAFVIPAHEAARRIGISLRQLQRFRRTGEGPAFMRLSSRRIAYRPTDIDTWLASRVVVVPATPAD